MSAITHVFVSPKPDGADPTLVRPSNWNANHKVVYQIDNITGAASILITDDVVRLQAGTYAVTVPAASGSGKQIFVCQDGAGTITLTPTGGDTIGGLSSFALTGVGQSCVLIDEAAGIWGLLQGANGGGTETLAQAYAAGSSAANQTLALLDTKGGGLVVDGTSASFTGANALQILDSPLNTGSSHNSLGISATFAPTSGAGAYNPIGVAYTINQTVTANGTVTGILVNATEISVRGTHNLLDLQVGAASRFRVNNLGVTSLNVPTGAIPAGAIFSIAYGNTGNLTASTEIPTVKVNAQTKTWSAGTITAQREVYLTAPTYAFVSASTIADASNLAVVGMPVPGSNATLTRAYSVYVSGGSLTPTAGIRTLIGNFTPGDTTFQPAAGNASFFGINLSYQFDATHTTGTIAGLRMNLTNLGLDGTGQSYLMLLRNGANNLAVREYGATAILENPIDSLTPLPALSVTSAAHTNITAGVETTNALFNFTSTKTWAAGAINNQREVMFQAPTYAFASASTITNASLVAIEGMPAPGANATITNAFALHVAGGTLTPTSGVRVLIGSNDTSNTVFQPPSGSASFWGLNVNYSYNPTNTTGTIAALRVDVSNLGSNGTLATSYLVQIRNNNTNMILVRDYGGLVVNELPIAGATPIPVLTLIQAAHTNITANTEVLGANFNFSATKTWATGAITTQREMVIFAPTYAFAASSTITTASTLAISGAPIQGANASITLSLALWIQSGVSEFNGPVAIASSITNPSPSILYVNSSLSSSGTLWNGIHHVLGTYTYTGGATTTVILVGHQIDGGALASTNAWTVTDYYATHIGMGVLSSGNVTVTRNWSLGVDGNVQLGGSLKVHPTIVSSTPYTVLTPAGAQSGDLFLISTLSSSSTSTINLPSISSLGDGFILIILDGGYAAATRNITVARNGTDKINNVSGNFTMNTNGQALRLISDSNTNNWHVW